MKTPPAASQRYKINREKFSAQLWSAHHCAKDYLFRFLKHWLATTTFSRQLNRSSKLTTWNSHFSRFHRQKQHNIFHLDALFIVAEQLDRCGRVFDVWREKRKKEKLKKIIIFFIIFHFPIVCEEKKMLTSSYSTCEVQLKLLIV